ncbi:MAG: ribosome-associated translation inhibitor RaiA [Planctomycetota bacterium]|nr:ribosome-associated translation inhibitor RaiA [Planctomycetota bacterium]
MIEVTVVGRHVKVTDGVREYAAEKADKLDRFHLKKIEVILSSEASGYKAEMIASSRRGKTFVAHAEFEDLHRAIDLTVEKLESQLARTKGKVREKRVRRPRSASPPESMESMESTESTGLSDTESTLEDETEM